MRSRPGATFPLTTDSLDLNSAIAESGVHRIEHALAATMEAPRNPDSLRRHGLDRTYRFHLPEGSDILDVVDRFSDLPEVEYAEPDFIAVAAAVFPVDPLFQDQWGFHQPSDADVDAPEAWEFSTGAGIVIGVVDGGAYSDHEDLLDQFDPGYDIINGDDDPEDTGGHGTGVASVAAADTYNGIGMAGACWNCRIMPVKVTNPSEPGSASLDAAGVVWATDHGARTINMSRSLGSTETLTSAIGYAYDAGVVVVASAGNDDATPVNSPARYVETIAVGASDLLDHRASFSNYGPRLDVIAPGVDIRIATIDGSYGFGSGTSYAAPLVTGLVGVVETIHPSAGREEVRHLIQSGADDQVGYPLEDMPGKDVYHGWGRVNMERTLLATASSVSLRVDGKAATRVFFETSNPLADSYDFVRGDLAALSEIWRGVDLGTVTCLEDDSPDPDTLGSEDLGSPQPGEGFFYLARFNAAPGAGSYGGSSRNRDRDFLLPSAARWIRDGEQDGAEFGYSVAGAGDVNDDTFDDVIVGVRSYTNDQVFEGGAFLYLGSPDGLQLAPAWIGEGNQTGSDFGARVATAGDVNGDGHDDVIVGAPFHDNGQTDEGRAYVFLGSASGLGSGPGWTVESDQAFARFGEVVAAAGDVNGDGYDDVLVTAPLFDGGHNNEGRAFVYLGSPTGLGTVPWTFESDQSGARLGFGAGSAGDVNNDGYDDVVLGAHRYDNGQVDEGRLYLFLGSLSGLGAVPTTIEIDVAGARLGRAASTAGDVNGDGFDDVVAGAVEYSGTEEQEGAVFVFLGHSGGLATSPAWSFASGQWHARLGTAAATAGDVNGDGFFDVIVGADAYDSTRSNEGGAWVFLGSASGLSANPDWIDAGGQPVAWYGWTVGSAGDVDHDLYDDVIVGAYGHDETETTEGRVYLYHGSASGPEAPPPTSDCGR